MKAEEKCWRRNLMLYWDNRVGNTNLLIDSKLLYESEDNKVCVTL